MKKNGYLILIKLGILGLLTLFTLGFFYFEPSFILRLFVVILSVIGLWYMSKSPEILVLIIFYLATFGLYNLHEGMGVSMALSMVVFFAVTIFIFYAQARLADYKKLLSDNIFNIYSWVTGLSLLEFFVALDFLPVDPSTKALILALVFYLLIKLFYLFSNNVLSFRRALGYVIVGIVVSILVVLLNSQYRF